MDSKFYRMNEAKQIQVFFGDRLCFLVDSTYVHPEQILHMGETVSRAIYYALQEFSLKPFSFVKDTIISNIQFWMANDVLDQLDMDPDDITVYLGVLENGPYINIDAKGGPYIKDKSL